MFLSLVVHLVLAATTLAAPHSRAAARMSDTVGVGHPALRNVTLRIGTDTSQIFAVQNGERRLVSTGIVTTSSTPTGYLVAMRNDSPRGAFIDSIWFDRGTFATRRKVEVGPNTFKRLVFDGAHMTGTIKDSTGEHAVDKTLDRVAIDNSIVSILSNALPLKAGYSVTIGAYDIGGHYQYMTMRVLGSEPVTRGASSVDAWKVSMDFTGPATWTVMRWVDAATKRELQWTMKFGEREMIAVTK
ncbi:MAG: hypothetical protein ABI664_23335 [bacterium]